MGGRGSSSGMSGGGGSGGIAQSKAIYSQLLQQGLNSNIKGIRAKAEEGTGNYSFKDATAVSFNEAMNMKSVTMKALTRGENTLVDGELPNGKHVYFANKTESPQIQTLLDKRKSKVDTTPNIPDDKRTTTTYDSWLKRNRRKFDSWYNGGKK